MTIENQKIEKPKYTLEDLERERQWDSGFGPNNPNAVLRENRQHAQRLKEIKESLIEQGILQKPEPTEQQKTDAELDKLYPNAKSRKIVEYNGKRYQSRYFPRDISRSGKTIHEWGHTWRLVEEKFEK